MQEINILRILMFTYGAIDDLYQKNVRSQIKYSKLVALTEKHRVMIKLEYYL